MNKLKRRSILSLLRLSLLAIMPILLSCVAAHQESAPVPAPEAASTRASRPNILFILTDDLDTGSIAHMPRLRELLIDRGTTFANFFVADALCCPSRASILRGQYPHNHQVLTNSPPRGGFAKFHALGHENSTVATWLKSAGYRTAFLGKYLNGYPGKTVERTYIPPGWDEWHSPIEGSPYSNFNYKLNENGRIVAYGGRPEDYLTDVLAQKAAAIVRRHSGDARPLFLYLATYAPHGPATPAPRHENAYQNVTAPRSPSFNEEDVSDKPQWVRNRPPLTSGTIRNIDEHYRRRLQSMLAVDEMLASLIEALSATGELERTYIFFTSDNGFHMGEHRLPPGKSTAYDEDIRVPLIVRGPGVPEGRVLQYFGLNIDLAPTFAELGGAFAPGFVDGCSLVPLLGRTPPAPEKWRQAVLVEHYGAVATRPVQSRPGRQLREMGVPEYHALRTKDYLYVEYVSGELELYDMLRDPYQMRSQHATANPSLMKQLASRLAALRTCVGASCRAQEDISASRSDVPSAADIPFPDRRENRIGG